MMEQGAPRVLFVAPQIPFPLDTGGKIRTFYQLAALAGAFRVDLLALGPELSAEDAADPLWSGMRRQLGEVVCLPRDGLDRGGALMAGFRSMVRGELPYPVEKYRSASAEAFIAERTEASCYDVVHFDSLHTFRFADSVAPGVRLVLDEHNVEALILERMAEVEDSPIKQRLIEHQAMLTDRFERACAQRAHRVLLCSEDDRDLLSNRTGRARGFEVVPNGVDPDRFDPNGAFGAVSVEGPYAMFLGSLDWWPNADGIAWFIEHVWPGVRARCPDLSLQVVGRNPSSELEALGGKDGVVVVGGVDDVRPWMQGCSAFVVPLRVGGGTRLKILEALAIGAPIVTTAIGCEGIDVVNGEHLLTAESPEAWAEAVSSLMGSPELSDTLARDGRALVKAHYSWEAIGRRLVAIVEEMLEEAR